jgi:hypothetical protein
MKLYNIFTKILIINSNHILSIFLHKHKTKELDVSPINMLTPFNIH